MQETHTQRIHREKNELEVEVATLGKMVETLRKDLDKTAARNGELEEEMGALRDTSWREKLLLSEIESMKLDMGRLIRLLSSTAEYREFRHLWEDSGGKPAPGSGIAGAAYVGAHARARAHVSSLALARSRHLRIRDRARSHSFFSGTCRRTACAAPTGGRRSTRCGSTSARTAAA